MNQVKSITSQHEETNIQTQDYNRFAVCEEVVDSLVEQGLPSTFNPTNYIKKIASEYGLTEQEARTCLKLAVKHLEAESEVEEKSNEKLYAQSGYFYPNSYSEPINKNKKADGMDSLSSLGSYNRLMFGIR